MASSPRALPMRGDALLANARPADAARAYERALAAGDPDPAAVRALTDLYAARGFTARARAVVRRYGHALPADERRTVEAQLDGPAAPPRPHATGDGALVGAELDVRPRHRVAFVCGPDQKFVTDLEAHVGRRHEVRVLHFQDQVDLRLVQEAMDWADVTWFEWCDALLLHASQRLRKTSRVVCRLHRYEAFSDVPGQVDWAFVDQLVLVAPNVRDVLLQRWPALAERVAMEVVYNGVDLDRFAFRERSPGFDLAYVGYLHHRKNPSLLLQCVKALVDRDPRYTLHIAGVHQQREYALYFEHMVDALGLGGHVVEHGWVDDVHAWLEDKQYLVSTSVHESFGYGIAEAMARGIKPLIHRFPGVASLYPEELVFDTVAQFVERVQEPAYASAAYRAFIEDHYGLDRQVAAVDALLRRQAAAAAAGA